MSGRGREPPLISRSTKTQKLIQESATVFLLACTLILFSSFSHRIASSIQVPVHLLLPHAPRLHLAYVGGRGDRSTIASATSRDHRMSCDLGDRTQTQMCAFYRHRNNAASINQSQPFAYLEAALEPGELLVQVRQRVLQGVHGRRDVAVHGLDAHLDLVQQRVGVDVPGELDLLVPEQLPVVCGCVGVVVVSNGRGVTRSTGGGAWGGRKAGTHMRTRLPTVWSSLLMVSVPELGIFSLAESFHSHFRSPSASRYDSERGGAFIFLPAAVAGAGPA